MPSLFETLLNIATQTPVSVASELTGFTAQSGLPQSFKDRLISAEKKTGIQGFKERQALAAEGKTMGFFDFIPKLIGGGIKLIGSALGVIPPKVVAAVRPVLPAAAVAAGSFATGALAFGGGGGAAAGGAPLAAPGGQFINPATGQIGGLSGGNGMFTTVTVVSTFNNQTGAVVKQRNFLGSPFLMNKEVSHLRSTTRKLMKGAARVPRRSVKQSTASKLKDQLEDTLLHAAQRQALPVAPCPA